MVNDRLGQSSRAKMIALIVAEQRPKALHKILWIGISDGLNCKNALLSAICHTCHRQFSRGKSHVCDALMLDNVG